MAGHHKFTVPRYAVLTSVKNGFECQLNSMERTDRNDNELKANVVEFILCFIGLVFMGSHKCEVIACLSSQVKCKLKNCYDIVYFTCGE